MRPLIQLLKEIHTKTELERAATVHRRATKDSTLSPHRKARHEKAIKAAKAGLAGEWAQTTAHPRRTSTGEVPGSTPIKSNILRGRQPTASSKVFKQAGMYHGGIKSEPGSKAEAENARKAAQALEISKLSPKGIRDLLRGQKMSALSKANATRASGVKKEKVVKEPKVKKAEATPQAAPKKTTIKLTAPKIKASAPAAPTAPDNKALAKSHLTDTSASVPVAPLRRGHDSTSEYRLNAKYYHPRYVKRKNAPNLVPGQTNLGQGEKIQRREHAPKTAAIAPKPMLALPAPSKQAWAAPTVRRLGNHPSSASGPTIALPGPSSAPKQSSKIAELKAKITSALKSKARRAGVKSQYYGKKAVGTAQHYGKKIANAPSTLGGIAGGFFGGS